MPVQTAAAPKQVPAALNGGANNEQHQTPFPPKKKSAKSERASMLCSTPPTCIKDKDCHVEYTRSEFLGEVRTVFEIHSLTIGWICSVLFSYKPTRPPIRC